MTGPSGLMWDDSGILRSIGSPEWLLDDTLQHLMASFENAGFKIYAVGGCVRDTALGHVVNDVDLSTDAQPQDTVRIVENLQLRGVPWKAVPTGIEHGTISAVPPFGGHPYEITTFRNDVETHGRHATVSFSTSIEDDAMRRDFTINALYAQRNGQVLDVVSGSDDLKAQRVRFIGDPEERIREDYLRILRFFRFTASHGRRDDGIDPEGLAACALLSDGLKNVSKERIGSEISRIVEGRDPAPIIGMMEQSGVLLRVLPGAQAMTLARLIDLEDQFPMATDKPLQSDLATRLASLGCDDLSERLRLSKALSNKVALVRAEAGSLTPPHELGYRRGFWPAVHCLLLRWATFSDPFDADAIDGARTGAAATFPVVAADLMPCFSGKSLGEKLKDLETVWIASGFTMDKAALLELV